MNVDLTDQTAEHFAVTLAESQSVHALNLKHCNISSVGAVSIFRSLEHHTCIEELDLSWNNQMNLITIFQLQDKSSSAWYLLQLDSWQLSLKYLNSATELPSNLIAQLEHGRPFARSWVQV